MKRKKLWIVLAVCLAIIIAVSVKAYFFFSAKPNIKINYVAEWNKLSKPANYDPCQNAYFDYKTACDSVVKQPDPINYPRKYPDWPDWPDDMNDGELKLVKDWIDKNSRSIYYFKQASFKPYLWVQSDENDFDSEFLKLGNSALNNLVNCIRIIEWDAKLNAFENNLQASADDVISILRTANLLIYGKKTDSKQFDGQVARTIAFRTILSIMENKKIDKAVLADLKKNLETIESAIEGKIDLEAERLMMYHNIQWNFSDDGKGNGHLLYNKVKEYSSDDSDNEKKSISEYLDNLFSGDSSPRGRNALTFTLTGADRKANVQMADKLIQYQYDLQDKLTDKQRKEKEEFISTFYYEGGDWDYPFLTDRRPQTDDIEAEKMAKVTIKALSTLVSILLYKEDTGSYPENLEVLVQTGYLKVIPDDPYGNGALTFKRKGEDFTLYSFGLNKEDDGGQFIRYDDGQIALWNVDGDTVFWPRPKEPKEEKEKRMEEQKKLQTKIQQLTEEMELLKKRLEN